MITADEPKVLVVDHWKFYLYLELLFLAQESDPECWDQLCGDGREDEGKDGAVQDGGQIVKGLQEEESVSSHGIFVSRLSLFNFCLINFGN